MITVSHKIEKVKSLPKQYPDVELYATLLSQFVRPLVGKSLKICHVIDEIWYM